MNHFSTETFDQNALAALGDQQLRGALRNLANTIGARRSFAIAMVADWEGLRDQARAIKDETLAHLDLYLEQFADNAARAGATIHWAHDAKAACQTVLNLIRLHGATKVVKSKSMATEEIHLNSVLEAAG